ncbi:NAD(P)-binding protein [Agrocybe pediades]|nr:NAD(P)-binding protein [Agrocybe pediades]
MTFTWLVTGSSSGFGRSITEAALKNGDNVIATLRKPSDLDSLVASSSPSQLLVLKCDVSSESDIRNAFEEGLAKFGTIDIVFNNAGFAILGEAESTPNDAAKQLFDVNFWGAANVSREAVRVFREVNGKEKGGWLLNVSSAAGILGFPACSYYCASKFALEGFTESLAQELDPSWNIKVTLLEFGTFRTKGLGSNMVTFTAVPAYEGENLPSQIARRYFSDSENSPSDAYKAALRIVEMSQLRYKEGAKLPLHWVIGKDSVQNCTRKLKSMLGEIEEFESWSDNLLLSDEYKPFSS